MRARAFQRWGAWILIVLGLLHITLFTVQALTRGFVPGWLAGDLRVMRSWSAEATQSEAAFWVSVGSFAVPLILLGALTLTLTRLGQPVPAYLGYGLGVWVIVCAVMVEPSGFPVGLIPVGLLIAANRLHRRAAGKVGTPA